MQEVRRVTGRLLRPYGVDEPVARDDLVDVEQQDGEQSSLFGASQLEWTAAGADFERPENRNSSPAPPGNPVPWVQNGTGATPASARRRSGSGVLAGARFGAASAPLQPLGSSLPPAISWIDGKGARMTLATVEGRGPDSALGLGGGRGVRPDVLPGRRAGGTVAARTRTGRLGRISTCGTSEAENARLRDAARLQAELVASVAHDLQTPLSSVIGYTDLLLTRGLRTRNTPTMPPDHRRRDAAARDA